MQWRELWRRRRTLRAQTIIGLLLSLFFFLVAASIFGRQLLLLVDAVAVMRQETARLVLVQSISAQTAEAQLLVQRSMTRQNAGMLVQDLGAILDSLCSERAALEEGLLDMSPEEELYGRTRGVIASLGSFIDFAATIAGPAQAGDWARVDEYSRLLNVTRMDVQSYVDSLADIATQRQQDAGDQVRRALNGMLWIASPFVLLALGIAMTVAGLITRNVRRRAAELGASAARLAAGRFDERVPVPVEDELGQLGHSFNRMTEQLQGLYLSLEQKVQERTADLARRSAQLQAAAQVAREATAILDIEQLLGNVVRLISDRFGFYHAGIFLLDEGGEYAVLRAASSEGGQRMLARGHKLKVGQVGIVGYVTGTGEPRIALDVGADAVFFDNPDLPLTRSEMALPLKVGDQIIGALDVQSTEPAAFSEEDVAVLSTMADQIAVAIQNSRLVAQTQKALEEVRTLHRQYIDREWARVTKERGEIRYEHVRVGPPPPPDARFPEIEQALRNRQHVVLTAEDGNGRGDKVKSALAVPIRLGDRVLGVLDLQETEQPRRWTAEEIALVETISDQMAQALERARLFEDTQAALATTEEQALRLALLNRMSEQLNRAGSVDEIMNIAAQHAQEIFGADRVHLSMLTEGQDAFEIRALNDRTGRAHLGERTALADTVLRPVIEENRLLLLTDVRDARMKPIRSMMAAPVTVGGATAGVLSVESVQTAAYTSRDGNLLLQVASLLSTALENRRLFEQARVRAEQLAVLNELGQALTATFNVQEVVKLAYQGASRLIDTTNFYLALYDPQTDMVNLLINLTELEDDGHIMSFPASRGLTGHVIRTRKPLLIKEKMEEVKAELGIASIGAGAQSWLGVPMMIGDQILGVIAVQSYNRTFAFDEEDRDLLIAVANQTAIALQNARLFEEARIRAEELAVLNDLAQALTLTLNVDEVLEQAYRGASRLVDTANFYIALYDEEKDEMRFPFNVTESTIDRQIATLPGGEGITGYVVRNRKSVLIEENLPARLSEMGITMVGETATCWLGVPMMIGERVLGVMAVQSYTTPRLYDEHDRDLLTAIASQTAIALQNAYLFAETQTALAETEALYKAGQRISAASSVTEILAAVAEEIAIPGVNRTVLWDAERDSEGEVVAFVAVTSWYSGRGAPPLPTGVRFSLGEFPSIRMALASEPFLSDDIQTDERIDHRLKVVFRQQGVSALAVLPLWVGGRQVGVVMVVGEQPFHFGDRERRLYSSLARQMAVAVDNLRLLDETSRRATQLATAAEVSRAASSILNLDELIPQTAELIRERFNYYYVGVFLVDESGRWAVLRAGTGEAGRRMLEAGHRLEVGGASMIGMCIAEGKSRVAFDVGEEAIHFDNPYLPDTRSEIALPLISRGRVIGAMTIQSTQPAAFTPEDITVLQTMADQLSNAIENARLFSETERALEETRELYQVSQAIGSAATPEAVRQALVDFAATAGVDLARILLLERDEMDQPTHVVMAESWTVDNRPVQPFGVRLSLQSYPFADFLQPSAQVVVENLHNDPRVNEAIRILMEVSGLRSFAVIPIAVGDRSVGGLLVGYDRPARYAEKMLDGLRTIASQAAIALQNRQLLEETSRRARELEAINEIGRAITSLLDPDELLRQIVDITKERFGHYYVSVALVEGDKLVSRSGSTVGSSGKRLERGIAAVDVNGPGLMAEAVRTGQAVLVGNVLEDPRYLMVPELAETRSELTVPITVKDRVIGVLDVQSDRPYAYNQTDVALLQSLVSQAGVAIENARLFAETEGEAQRRALINEVMEAASRSLDPADLLHRTGEVISRRLGAPSAIFRWQAESEVLIPAAVHDASANDVLLPAGMLVTRDMNPTLFEAVEQRRTRVLESTALLRGPLADMAARLRIGSALYTPLISRDQVTGVLDICRLIGQPLPSAEEISFAEIVARNLGVALENARLYQEAVETARRLTALNAISTALTRSMDLEDILQDALTNALAIAGFESGLITAIHPVSEQLYPVVSQGMPEETIEASRQKGMEGTLSELVYRLGQPMAVRDLAEGASVDVKGLLEQGFRSYLGIPLISKRQSRGTICLFSRSTHSIEPGIINLMQAVGRQIAVAMENIRLYQEAVETAERLQEVDRLKTQFLANMSHELRTPLNSIIGFSRVILKGIDGPITDLQKQDLEAIHASGQHLLGLINDILDISKIEAGKMELAFEPVDLKEIIRGVMSTAIALVKDKPVELQQAVADDLPLIQGDARRLRQVVLNLVSNACKFTDEGFVRVSAEVDGDMVKVAVTDSGIGIPPDKIGTIFEAFTQADASPSRKYGGTGLGLTISRQLVELHGGTMWVESVVGEGSTFTFTIPIEGPRPPQPEEAPAAEPAAAEEAPAEGEGRLVLCVDDDEGVITLYRRYLRKQGFQVAALTDPGRVVEEVKRLKPYAVTLDVMMPGKDGWAVIQELKDDPETRHVPVIMCTIVAEKGRGMSLGAADYLVKPIMEQDLIAALERLDREAGRHRVLVVDDQAEDRNLLRRIIESQDGYEVIEAAGGQEAIALVKEVRPHIVVLDLMMPEVDGFAVLEAIKADESTRTIPIIVVTAKELTAEERALLNHRIEGLIQKGVLQREELLEDVAAALRKLGRSHAAPHKDSPA